MNTLKTLIVALTIACASILTNAKTIDCSGVPYAKIKRSFETLNALGLETQLDLADCNIERIRTAAVIKDYLFKVTKLINMRLHEQPTINHFSDGGATGYAFSVNTPQGLIWGRCINRSNRMLVSLFCLQHYDPALIAELTKKQFGAADCTVNTQLRV